MTKLNCQMPAAPRRQRLGAVICVLVASMACSTGKGTTATSDASSDNGLALNIDGKVNSDGKADTALADADSADLDGLAYDVIGQPDLPGYDVLADCPGGALCPCKANTDCQSGLCLEDLSVDGGKACAKPCKPSCGPGYVCANLSGSGSDIQQVCVYQAARLCDPCGSSKDCEVAGLAESKCVDQGALGRFCGVACLEDGDCPGDYACQQVVAVDGGKFKQCVRKADAKQAPFGVCPCSTAAVAKELQTSCATAGSAGSGQCIGVRKCSAQGLSVCLAAASTAETCDGTDNDCDGETDEATCDDSNPCTSNVCAGNGGCKFEPQLGASCDDGNPCTAGDTCGGDGCDGKPIDLALPITQGGCSDGNPCTADSCQPTTGCTHKADAFLPCDDGNPCTKQDVCSNGECKPGTFDCICVKDTDCLKAEDGNACNGTLYCGKQDGIPMCLPKPGSAVICDTGKDGPCITTTCAPASGQCVTTAAPDGQSCSDGTACTSGDACLAGQCTPGPTVQCNDNNACTADSCEPAKGCQFQVLGGEKQACYGGPAGTAGTGTCKQGSQFCDDKGQLGECTGAVMPAAKEQCDGLDDTCDGATDEGCAAKDFEIGFAGARLQGGSGKTTVQVAVGRSLVTGGSMIGGQTSVMWGFWKWFKGVMP